MEADLAFRGIDLRDFYRRGAGLTLRRLLVLIRGLPPDSITHLTLDAEREKTEQTDVMSRLRARQAHYDALSKGAAG